MLVMTLPLQYLTVQQEGALHLRSLLEAGAICEKQQQQQKKKHSDWLITSGNIKSCIHLTLQH